MRSTSSQILVGLFMLAGFAALAMLGYKVSNFQEFARQDSYTLIANFTNIGGLKVRSPVKVGGVVVGRVSKIELDNRSLMPVVYMAITAEYDQFPSESSAAIQTSGLLGEQFISLTPGGDEVILEDGDEIEDTQSALVLEDLIGQFLFNRPSDNN